MQAPARRGLVLAVWALAIWGLASVAWTVAFEAASQARAFETLRTLWSWLGVSETVAVATVLAGWSIVARRLGPEHGRGPAMAALMAAFGLLGWNLMMLAMHHLIQPDIGPESVLWLYRIRVALVIVLWVGSLFALARIAWARTGLAHFGLAALGAALIVWLFGTSAWAGMTEPVPLGQNAPWVWVAIRAGVQLGAIGIVLVLLGRALRAIDAEPGSPPPYQRKATWGLAGSGLRFAASAIVARVIIVAVLCLMLFVVPLIFAAGLLPFAKAIVVIAILATSAAVCAGMFCAAATPSADASTMAAASTTAFLIALSVEAQFLIDSLWMPRLELAAGAAQLLGLLFMLGYVYRVAGELGRAELRKRAAGLHAVVFVMVGGTSLLSHAVATDRLSSDFAPFILIFLLIASVVVLLAVTKAAHLMSDEMKKAGEGPVATVSAIVRRPTKRGTSRGE